MKAQGTTASSPILPRSARAANQATGEDVLPALRGRIERAVDTAIADNTIVGTVVMVAHRGKTVYARAAGLADREAGVGVRLDTIFRYASVTKPLVAATTLAMIEKGLLELDQPVTDFLPWFAPKLADGTRPVITIRHLLTHTAGIVYGGPEFERLGVNGGLLNSDISLEDNLKLLAGVPLLDVPGAAWVYSKSIDVVGGVLGAIVGGTLGDAVKTYVTGPLGMADTSFLVTERSRLAVAYGDAVPEPLRMGEPHFVPARKGGDGRLFSPARILNPKAFHSGGAGMAGTAPDLLKFLETLRQGGAPILSRASVAAGFSNQIGAAPRGPNDAGTRFGFFGAIITDPALAHSPCAPGTIRWGGVYGNSWFIDPANELSVVALTNTALEGCDGAFPDAIRDAVYPV